MAVFLIIVAIIIIGIIVSNNKEKERQENRRRDEVYSLMHDYYDGYESWSQRPENRYHDIYNLANSNDYILSHKEEIKKLDKEIKDKYKAEAKIDEEFEREQKSYSDKCYSISKESLPSFGRYNYDFEWHKSKPSGGWTKEKLRVWQFFAEGVCFANLDYTYRDLEKKNADVFPEFKDRTRHWIQPVYDKINGFISRVSSLSTRPLIVVLVDYKYEWAAEAIEYHFQKIDKSINNTVFISLSQLRSAPVNDKHQIEHVVVIDVYSENSQLIRNCEDIEKIFGHPHAAITYISLLKCYDKNEMENVLEKAKIEAEQRRIHSLAETIKNNNPNGYERWSFSLELNGHVSDISDKMIVDAEEAITNQQQIFERGRSATIKRIKETASTWEHLTSDFTYKYLLRYYPITCDFEATDEEWEDRYRVWNFKYDPQRVSKEEHEEAMAWVLNHAQSVLVEEFGRESLPYLTMVCIPASSMTTTELRYSEFSNKFCNASGMTNAYSHIRVTQDATPKHLGGNGQAFLKYDEDFFQNKNVILFDDVITRGNSMLRMKAKMEELGATVIAGLTIGKTFHHRPA